MGEGTLDCDGAGKSPPTEGAMSDHKSIRDRLGTISRESQLLVRDLAGYGYALGCWAYRQTLRQMGRGGETPAQRAEEGGADLGPSAVEGEPLREEEPRKPAGDADGSAGGSGKVSEEGFRPGQVWRPADSNKTARKITQVYREGDAVYLVWEPPEGGKASRIQEPSFTRWARREQAELEEG